MEARVFRKIGEAGVAEMRFTRGHAGITGNEEADKLANWEAKYTRGEGGGGEEGEVGRERWSMKELKEEGKAGMRAQRERMLRETMKNTGEREIGETARY